MEPSTSSTDESAVAVAGRMRRHVLDAAFGAREGHIGSALSVVDILAVLFAGVFRGTRVDDPDRDRFILSKGHAASALYAALVEIGVLTPADLQSYCQDGSLLATHPEQALVGVDFAAGSLGQGLSIGAGSALAARIQRSERSTYVLMSDAECDSGAVWEAALFAGHYGLASLTVIVDANGQQALGYTRDVLDIEPLAEKWEAFRWDVVEVDGHAVDEIEAAISNTRAGKPRVIIARTQCGHGVSFMEGTIKWHYVSMSDAEYEAACRDIDRGGR